VQDFPKTIKLVWQMKPIASTLVHRTSIERRSPKTTRPCFSPQRLLAQKNKTITTRRKAHHRHKPLSENFDFHNKTPSC